MFSDQSNLVLFRDVIKRAYREAKQAGRIPERLARKVDKRLGLGPVYTMERNGHSQKIMVDRLWRRRIAKMYWRQDDTEGKWYENIDWQAIYNWIMENIVPIVRVLVMLIPLVL